MSIRRFGFALSVSFGIALGGLAPVEAETALLTPADYRHYFTAFAEQEAIALGRPGDDSWLWMERNIPWFETSAADFEELYYFRWYAFRKHVVATPTGSVVTEFLPKVGWGGAYNTIVDSAPFHLYEARWLRDRGIAQDDARFWMSAAAAPRAYSVWLADAVRAVTLATGDRSLGRDLLPALAANWHAWETTHRDANGLYWSIDTRDAMEKSISGDGYRPTLNSYMYGDAAAISAIATQSGDATLAKSFTDKAKALRRTIEQKLWNPDDGFYEVVSPAATSGIRQERKFVDPGSVLTFSGVRELIGYIPWYFHLAPAKHDGAWRQLFDPMGFAGHYGPTTAERRSPRFRFANDDQCQWNGPSWPFATTQTLVALANLMNDRRQSVVSHADYLALFQAYVRSQRLPLENGQAIPWIDENLDADTGEWVARGILLQRHSPNTGRGAYYNHSGFSDPLITGLIGLRPRDDDTIAITPLLPPGAWRYFAIDGLPYHGHLLAIVYDADGQRYHRGRGLMLYVDGKKRAARRTLGPLEYRLE